jgi:hypothetical protein
MAQDARAFNRRLGKFVPNVQLGLGQGIIRVGKVARLMEAKATPIDTGRASASWNASLNGPNTRVQPPEYYNPGAPWNDGEVNLDQFVIGDSIHISNSLPYVKILNCGFSKQQRTMWIERTFAEAKKLAPTIIAAQMKKQFR